MRSGVRAVLVIAALLATSALGACGGDENEASTEQAAEVKVRDVGSDATTMVGPNGETATLAEEVEVTPEQEEQIREGDHSVAFVWHGTDTFTRAIELGARERFDELGIEVVATTDAEFDASKQKNQLETVLARRPDALVTFPVDAATAAPLYRPAVEQGVELLFISNTPEGFEHGRDYAGIVSSDTTTAARQSAQLIGDAMGGEGKLGILFYDQKFFIVNEWDKAFEETLRERHPDIEIVAKEGFADPAKAEEPARGMLTRNPDLDAMYVSWQGPAVGVLSALRSTGRDDVDVTMVGLSEPIALDMARGGAVVGVGVDLPYDAGRLTADSIGLALLGEELPPFAVTGSTGVTRSSLLSGWQEAYGEPAPRRVQEALGGEE